MRFSIEFKHYAISAIVALALATIALLTWYRSNYINDLGAQIETIHTIDTSLQELHKIHVDFVTLYDSNHLDDFRAKYETMNANIKQLAVNLNSLGLGTDIVSEISDKATKYKSQFESIALLQLKIGKDQTEGIRKEMRNSLYTVESVLNQINDENLRLALHRRLLMTQRTEKDLMLRRQDKYLDKFKNYYAITTGDVKKSIKDPELKSQLLAALAAYKGFFKQLSEAALEIGLTYEDGLRNEANTTINSAHIMADELSRYVNVSIAKKESEINSLILIACVAFSAIIIFLIFRLTRSIVQPLKDVTGAMTELAGGNYAITIMEKGRVDEIGKIIKALKVFKINAMERDQAKHALEKAHNELEKRVKERTRELTEANQHLDESKKKAEAANTAKGNFLANMSHELRTPLNAIIGFSSSLKEEIFGKLNTEKQREYVNDINISGLHLLELINDILDVSAIEAGKVELNEESVKIKELVNDAVRLISPRSEKSGVKIIVSLPSSLPMLYADARRLQQILLNMLSNAVKFSNDGDTVTISANFDIGSSITLSVSDTGVGMDEKELATAMEPFGQVLESSDTRSHEGTGLGLPLTRSLAEMHGGIFEIESEKGSGTNVSVTFQNERVIWET